MSEAKVFRILIAEDDDNLRYLTERQLTFLGHLSDQARNGWTAVEKARSLRYDLILMDVMLPDLDGMEATNKIRADENSLSRETPIIAMTAFAERQQCLDIGMDDFVLKPVTLQQLKEILSKWLHVQFPETDPNDETSSVSESSFKKTENDLAAIDERIRRLRERYNL